MEPLVAVVTGAGEGIGRAIVEDLLATTPARVVAVDRNPRLLDRLLAAPGGRVRAVLGDVAEWATHESAADAAAEEGRLAWWVNNAGTDVAGGAHEVTADDIAAGLRVNQYGPMYGTAVAVRRLMPHGGSIVNISSIQGMVAFPRYFAYQSAKAAIIMLTRGVAMDYGRHAIRCNVVCPGTIASPMFERGLSEDPTERARQIGLEEAMAPLGRVGTTAEVAKAVTFLLSDDASFISGAVLTVDGGASTRCFAYPTGDSTG